MHKCLRGAKITIICGRIVTDLPGHQKGPRAPCCASLVTGNFRPRKDDEFMAIKYLKLQLLGPKMFHKNGSGWS